MEAKGFLDKIIRQITVYETQEAREIAFWLLEHFCGLSKIDVLMNKNIAENDIDWQKIIARLNDHEPIQYILGETIFCGNKFLVNSSVLIPRPETEELVGLSSRAFREMIASFSARSQTFAIENHSILDIGTGSGCIAISLAKLLTNDQVYGWDISVDALEMAKKNALLNDVKVSFEQNNILKSQFGVSEHKFSLIVSNPPYITQKEAIQMRKNVLNFEPHLALFVADNEALIFYEAIANFARKLLINKGLVLVEINENYGKETAQLFSKQGFSEVIIIKDIHGKNRFVKATNII